MEWIRDYETYTDCGSRHLVSMHKDNDGDYQYIVLDDAGFPLTSGMADEWDYARAYDDALIEANGNHDKVEDYIVDIDTENSTYFSLEDALDAISNMYDSIVTIMV